MRSADFELPIGVRNGRVRSDDDISSEEASDRSHEDRSLSACDLDKPVRNPEFSDVCMWVGDDCECTDPSMCGFFTTGMSDTVRYV